MNPNGPTDSPEEILDIVDENDLVIDTKTRQEVYEEDFRSSIRVVNAFIKNSSGQLWVPRRAASKKLYPNTIDFSIAGHVESGDTYEKAFVKETREEVGLSLTADDYQEIGYFSPHRDGVAVWMKVYEIYSDEAPELNPREFSDFEWLTPEEILAQHETGEEMKSDIPIVLRLCYS